MRTTVLLAGAALVAAACTDGSSLPAEEAVARPAPTNEAPLVTTAAAPSTTSDPGGTVRSTPVEDELVVASETDPGFGTAPAQLELALVGCQRITTTTDVDADVARSFLEPGQEPAIRGALAMFSLSVLQCTDLLTDGHSHGSGGFATAWLRLEDEAPPSVPVDAGIDPAGTDFYHPIMFQTDNLGFAEATADFGVPMRLATMTFEPSAAGTQSGTVEQRWTVPPVSYRWTVDNVHTGSVPGAGAVHTLVGSTVEGIPLTYVGVFTHTSPGWLGNLAAVDVDETSLLADLVGDGYESSANGTDVSVHMSVLRDDPVAVFDSSVALFPIAVTPTTRIQLQSPDGPCDGPRPVLITTTSLGERVLDLGYVVARPSLARESPPGTDDPIVADIAWASQSFGATVRWLRAHADEYCVSPDSIAVLGYSWTAIAALSLGYTSGELTPGEQIELDELGDPVTMPDVAPLEIPPNLAAFSPTPNAIVAIGGFALAETIDAGEPPALLVNGTNDGSIPFALAEATCTAAAAVGVTCELVSHDDGHALEPRGLDTVGLVVDFLDRNMPVPARIAGASHGP